MLFCSFFLFFKSYSWLTTHFWLFPFFKFSLCSVFFNFFNFYFDKSIKTHLCSYNNVWFNHRTVTTILLIVFIFVFFQFTLFCACIAETHCSYRFFILTRVRSTKLNVTCKIRWIKISELEHLFKCLPTIFQQSLRIFFSSSFFFKAHLMDIFRRNNFTPAVLIISYFFPCLFGCEIQTWSSENCQFFSNF